MNNNLSKAKAALIIDQPFFASILLSMPIVEDNSIPTMATDGEKILFNKEFLESMTLQETIFVLAHETLHCVFEHMHRLEKKSANRWNQACDYVINDLLTLENIGSMPKQGLLDSALVQKGNGTAEGVYALLPKENESKEVGQSGGSLDSMLEPKNAQGQKLDQSQVTEKQNEMKVKVIQARNAAKMRGKLSAGMARLIGDLVKTETDWRQVLRHFITEKQKSFYSFAKPKRRFLAENIYLPSMTGEKLGKIAIAVDCSGSVTPELLNIFSAEINAIFQDCGPSEIKVIYFDSRVLKTEIFEETPIKLQAIGGGGTDFAPIFEALKDDSEGIAACIVLTDLQCDSYGDCPDFPVLWASYDLEVGPNFGEIVKIGCEK
jgi:predicted metal-dependent peptidase